MLFAAMDTGRCKTQTNKLIWEKKTDRLETMNTRDKDGPY